MDECVRGSMILFASIHNPNYMRLFFSTVVLLIIVLFSAPTRTAAQWTHDTQPLGSEEASEVDGRDLFRPDFRSSRESSDLALFLAGAGGAAVGSVGGAFIGYNLDRQRFHFDSGDDPGLMGAIGGWFAGSAIVTPLSVYLANGGQGPLSTAYVSSAVIGSLGMVGLLATANSSAGVVFLFGTPVAQAISAAIITRNARP